MKKCIRSFSILLSGVLASAAAHGQVTIDGTKDAGYGTALAVQTVQTQFGDTDGTIFGSELDAAYATIEGGNLNLLLTGNLETNFNKYSIFIDSVAGGQNVIGPDTDNGGVNPTNDGWARQYNGFTFDSGFEADFLLIVRHNETQFDLDFNSVGNDSTVEANFDVFLGAADGSASGVGASGLSVALDNSNILGVAGGTEAADTVAAAAVNTGFEVSIPLSALGNPAAGSTIRISAQLGNGDFNFFSNQFLGSFAAPQANLGSDGVGNFDAAGVGAIDMNNFAGDQFFSITVPGGSLLGDFDGDGDVDLVDLDQYNGNIGADATGALAALDFDNNGTVDASDFQRHYEELVETSNGGKGTFAGDINLDGTVDVLGDAFILVRNLGNSTATSWSQGDVNASGNVDVLGDAFLLVANLGMTAP